MARIGTIGWVVAATMAAWALPASAADRLPPGISEAIRDSWDPFSLPSAEAEPAGRRLVPRPPVRPQEPGGLAGRVQSRGLAPRETSDPVPRLPAAEAERAAALDWRGGEAVPMRVGAELVQPGALGADPDFRLRWALDRGRRRIAEDAPLEWGASTGGTISLMHERYTQTLGTYLGTVHEPGGGGIKLAPGFEQRAGFVTGGEGVVTFRVEPRLAASAEFDRETSPFGALTRLSANVSYGVPVVGPAGVPVLRSSLRLTLVPGR